MGFTVTHPGGTEDAEFQAYIRLLRQEGEDVGKLPRVADPGATQPRRWLNVWPTVEAARRFAALVQSRHQEFVTTISSETGKPFWESSQEVDAVMRKVELSIEAYRQRTGYRAEQTGSTRSVLSHSPHGVVAVLGPFNFPAHLPNGHIVPALIAGNSIVFKPSELTPNTGALMADCWREAGLPAGCLNLVQGGGSTAELILQQPEIAGVFLPEAPEPGSKFIKDLPGAPR